MRMVSRTDVGRIRTVNEDRAVVQHLASGYSLAIVADGMGGHQAGDVASQMAIEIIGQELENIPASIPLEERRQRLVSAVHTANTQIYQVSVEQEQYKGMGTTVVAALATDQDMLIAHIGDSRAYKLNGDTLVQLTADHSLVNELVKSGQITPEEASHHPRRNVLLRALGTEPEIETDVTHVELVRGDVFILCSDGLSNLIESETIASILHHHDNLESAADLLVRSALQAGGDDNITVVLMQQTVDSGQERGDD